MKKLLLILGLTCLFSARATAQDFPGLEVFGGYQYTHLQTSINASGWNASATGNLNHWLGGTADFSGAYKSGLHFHTYMFGPVFALRKSEAITPFAHVLVGAAKASNFGSTTGFSMAVGGGLDVKLGNHFALRLVQGDWLPFRSGPDWVKKNVRVSTGIVLRF